MVRSIVSMLVAVLIIACASIYENVVLANKFDDFHEMLDTVYDKFVDDTATEDDVISIQNHWLTIKHSLHVFIPHTEIKEIDLWISECITYAHYDKKEDAQAKIEVVRELCEQIPKTFLLRVENLF